MNFWKTFAAALAAVVVGMGMVFVFSLIFGISILAMFGGESTKTSENSVLYIDLNESIIDSPSTPTIDLNSMSVASPITILQTLSAIEAAATDDNIKGICIYLNGPGSVSGANIEEHNPVFMGLAYLLVNARRFFIILTIKKTPFFCCYFIKK